MNLGSDHQGQHPGQHQGQHQAERNESRDALQETEERLRFAQAAAGIATWDWNLVARTGRWSPEFNAIWGIDPASIEPTVAGWIAAIHPDDRERIAQETLRLLEKDEFTCEFRVLHPERGVRWLVVRGRTIRGEFDLPLRMAGILSDTTDAKEAEAQRRRVEEDLKAALERTNSVLASITEAFFVLDTGFRFVEVNPAAVRQVFGRPAEELIGRGFWDVFPQGRGSRYQEEFVRAMREQKPAHFEARSSIVDAWFEAHVWPRGDRIEIYMRDITGRKLAEEELRESEERFRTLAEALPALVWTTDPEGRLTWYNQRYAVYTGLEVERGMGSRWTDVVHPSDVESARSAWTTAETGGGCEIEHRIRRSDGSYLWHLTRALPMRAPRGGVIRWFGTSTDIHAQKLAQKEREFLLQSERAARSEAERQSRIKDEFLATLSHELRTPLSSVIGWAQLLRSGSLDPGEATEALEIIESSAHSQKQLIDDLLDMSRILAGKLRLEVTSIEAAGLAREVLATITPSAEAKGVALTSELRCEGALIRGDRARLHQVLWNILTNAVKFTPRGGSVEFRTEVRDGSIMFTVSDTGIGIQPEFLPHIFERFRQADASTTRRHRGLGLGLSIVNQLVGLHGGSVWAESAGENLGAMFTVSLPVEVPKGIGRGPGLPEGAVAPGVGEISLSGVSVLVVDDEPDARKLYARVLEERGASVTTAASAAEALALIEAAPPDVLVSDISMPGEDGYSLIRKVRAMPKPVAAIPAVALTALARVQDRAQALRSGYQAHVAKPVSPPVLVAQVAGVMPGRIRRAV